MTLSNFFLFCFHSFYLFNFTSPEILIEQQEDVLLQEIKKPKSIEEIDAMNNHAFSLKGSYPDSLLLFASISLEASQKSNYQKGIAHSYTNYGVYHYQKANHGQAVEFYLKANDIYIKEKLLNKSASTSNNIGSVYYREKDFQKALEYHQKAIDISDENESLTNLANYKLNKATALSKLKSFEEALPTYFEAIRDLEKSGENVYIATGYLNLGNQFGAHAEFDSVKKYFDKGLETAEKTTDFEILSYAYTSQIRYYTAIEKPRDALKYAERSLKNSLTSGSNYNISEAYFAVAGLQEATGDIKGALENLKNHYMYKDSLRENEQTLQIARLEAQKSIEKEKALFDLELKNKEESNQQKALIIAQLIFLVITVVVLFFLVSKNLRKSKERNQILSVKNQEIEELAANLKSLNTHQNQIFSIIGHDLRGPVNSLIAVTDLISEKQLDQVELEEIIPSLSSEIKRAGITLENLLHWALSQREGQSILPIDFNLKHLFEEIIASLQYAIDRKKLQIKLQIPHEIELHADKQMIEISLRNLISNAIKFTKKNGSISCIAKIENNKILILIEDTGTGIDSKTLAKLNQNILISNFGTQNEKGTGLGLALCKGYIEKNRGTIEISSEVGVGTKVLLRFEA